MFSPNPRSVYFPILGATAYLFGTFLVLPFVEKEGYEVQNPVVLTAFVFGAYACLFFGFVSNAKRLRNRLRPSAVNNRKLRIMQVLLVVSSLHMLVDSVSLMVLHDVSMTSFGDPGSQYQHRLETEREGTASPSRLRQIIVLTSFLQAFCVPIAVLTWQSLQRWCQGVCLLAIGTYCAYYIGVGTNIGPAKIVVFAVTALVVRYYGNWAPSGSVFPRARHWLRARRLRVSIVCLLLLFALLFSYNLHSRSRAYGMNLERYSNSALGRVFSPRISESIHYMLSYASHAYIGLSYDLAIPFQWTYGIGHSRAAMKYARQYFEVDVYPRHYMVRTEQATGWPMNSWWSTIFPWIASDITFFGCLLFMLVLGRLYARCWFESTVQCRLSSAVAFCQLSLLILFVPMNNQLMQSRSSFWSTIVLAAYWVVDHLRHQSRK